MTPTAPASKTTAAAMPVDKEEALQHLREVIARNLPEGFAETEGKGYINFVVPHSTYPAGYHCNPKQPLPFISITAQKSHLSFHHLGLYADPALVGWFAEEYPKYSPTKLDMGKGCVRFKKPEQIPYALIGELVKKITPQQWIAVYETNLKRSKKS